MGLAPKRELELLSLDAEGLAHLIYVVEALPGEELDVEAQRATVVVIDRAGHVAGLTAEVSVARRSLVDRLAQLQALLDGVGA